MVVSLICFYKVEIVFSQSDITLIDFIQKTASAENPISVSENIPMVYSSDSVNIKMQFNGKIDSDVKIGIDVIFLIDQSGSEKITDPGNWRLRAIGDMATQLVDREELDLVTIITFNGDMESDSRNSCVRFRLNRGKWSEVLAAIDNIPEASGLTPTQWGMETANNLLLNSDRLYKLVILLSDGMPEPETTSTQQLTIIMNDLTNTAVENRIIYSTVYIAKQDLIDRGRLPTEMAWMKYVSERTNYVSPEDLDKYYIEVFDAMPDLVEAYRKLFETLEKRMAPQEVTIYEKISDKLKVDPNMPIIFIPNQSYLVDYNELEVAKEVFKQTGIFSLKLKELTGIAELSFNVILDMDAFSPHGLLPGYSDDYWETFIDLNGHLIGRAKVNHEDSTINYLKPTFDSSGISNGGTEIVTIPCCGELVGIHQAQIDYMLGFNVTKNLNQERNKVILKIDNSTSELINWYWVKELPSQYFDTNGITDNINFRPFKMIYENLINLDQFPEINVPHYGQSLSEIKRPLEKKLNPYLNTFTFDVVGDDNLETRWAPLKASGIFRMGSGLPSMEKKWIQFSILPISFLTDSDAPSMQTVSKVDFTIKDILTSSYKTNNQDEKLIIQNPTKSYFISNDSRPDLRISNCFTTNNIDKFYEKIRSPSRVLIDDQRSQWAILDSKDVDFIGVGTFRNPSYWSNIIVTVHNDGNNNANSTMMVRTIIIPVIKNNSQNYWGIPIYAEQTKRIIIPPLSQKNIGFRYDKYQTVDPRLEEKIKITKEYIQTFVEYIAINTVDITNADGENYDDNNRAIEIINTMNKKVFSPR